MVGAVERNALCKPALDICDIRDIPSRAEWVPAIQQDPPSGHRISIVARRVIVQLARGRRWLSLGAICVWKGSRLTEPTSTAKTMLAPCENMVDTGKLSTKCELVFEL